MFWLLLTVLLVQQEASQPSTPEDSATQKTQVDEDAWEQEARDWLVACRTAYGKLDAKQTQALAEEFQKLSPAALRVLVTVYEQTYRIASPLSAADLRAPNVTQAQREWIMAYRILYDRLSVEDSKAYAKTLEAMTPGQIQALVQVYQERNRLHAQRESQQGGSTAHPTTTPDEQEKARQRMLEAQQLMQFEQERRQLALGRASTARKQTGQALASANASAHATAAAANQRIRDMEEFSNIQTLQHNDFQNRMYERSTPANPYSYNGFRFVPFY